MLLTIGYAMLALAAILVCADATSLYLAQKRLDGLADAAALAAADGFTVEIDEGEPVARLDDRRVWDQATELVLASGGAASVVDAASPDGVSARVTVTAMWRPPVLTVFVPDGLPLLATATSRTAIG